MDYKKALENNPNLTEEVKSDLEYLTKRIIDNLVPIFGDYMNIDDIYQKLENINIRLMPRLGSYGLTKNDNGSIQININQADSLDGDNVDMQILLTHLFPNNNNDLESMHVGLTQDIANLLVGGSNTSDEYTATKLFSDIIEPNENNPNPLFVAYFKSDMNSLMPTLKEKIGEKELHSILSMMNQNYMTQNTRTRSLIPSILKELIDAKLRTHPDLNNITYFRDMIMYCGEEGLTETVKVYFSTSFGSYLQNNPDLIPNNEIVMGGRTN